MYGELLWCARAITLCLVLAPTFILNGCAASPHCAEQAYRSSETLPAINTFALLREATDHEALYTLAGGLKPMSTGIWSAVFTVDEPDLTELRGARAALAPLRNDLWYADVQVFDHIHEGQRSVHAYVVHRRSFARMIDRYELFWGAWGITPCTHPSEVIAVVDRMPRADRWRAYGYLFGYPADAVEFFVQAGLAAEDGREVGPGKDRRFIQIPTYAADTGRYTYAVPLDHIPTRADEDLADQASRILAAYTHRRDRMTTTQATITELRRLNRQFEHADLQAAISARDPAITATAAAQGVSP